MRIVHREAELRGLAGCVFVPTMGGLHAGHAALVQHAARIAVERSNRSEDRSRAQAGFGQGKGGGGKGGGGAGGVVSVFVNPTQFDVRSDFERYPRTLADDASLVASAWGGVVGGDDDDVVVFAPEVDEVYPPGVAVRMPALPGVAFLPGLEDRHRPGHFAGVCQVVRRLFEMVRPSVAVFGEKDWQQLQVVRAMTQAEGLDIEIVPSPTVREADGLAMSSRNRFLSVDERARASAVWRALEAGRGCADPVEAEALMRRVLEDSGLAVEYAAVRNAATLGAWTKDSPGRALIAARLGSVRLIDNVEWGRKA